MVAYLRGGVRPSSSPIIPGNPNLSRSPLLGVVAYGFWVPVLQAPVRGRPVIVGGLPPPLPRGRIHPSPRVRNSRPSLPMIPISPLLCARVRVVTARGVPQSLPRPLSPVPSPIIPYRVIRLVRRYSIFFVVVVVVIVVVVALEISTLCTSYHQLSPPNKKIGFVSCLA